MNINKAKEFYISMGCSHFHMARESQKKYEEYLKLKIDVNTEKIWSIDSLNSYINLIKAGNFEHFELWHAHSRLCKIAQNINDKQSHIKLIEITKYIFNFLPKNMWIIIAENIIGRSELEFKSGLIFQSFNSGFIDIAFEYLKYSRIFSQFIEGIGMDYERCLNSQKKCDNIAELLNL